jgi:sarcosine oxidase subunit beta
MSHGFGNSGFDAIVIGGGLHGCTAALQLALRKLGCLVIEKDTVGRHASGVNAGGVRRLGRDPAEIPLSVVAMEMWWRIAELVGDDCGFRLSGQIKIAENEAEMAALEERARLVRSLGYEHEEVVDAEELFRLVPALSRHCVGGLVARRDGFALPYRTTKAFRDKAASLGVRFLERTRVLGVERRAGDWIAETDKGRFAAPVLVNCAGGWGDAIAAATGDPVPFQVVAPMMMVSARLPPFLTPVVGAAGRKLSFKQMDNGTVVIGGGHFGGADAEAGTTSLDFGALATSARTVAELFPVMRGTTIVRCWAGLEGFVEDGLPVIGPGTGEPGLYHAFGFSTHGFQLGPVVGRILADLVTEGRSDLPIAPFRIDRFAVATEAS